MNQRNEPYTAKTDDELRTSIRSSVRTLVILSVLATLYGMFLLYSAASGKWNWWMGAAVVPLLALIIGTLVPMTQLATSQQELARRHDSDR